MASHTPMHARWRSNRDPKCPCDWCVGWFNSTTGNWFMPNDHPDGTPVDPADQQCSKNVTVHGQAAIMKSIYSPTAVSAGLTGLNAWLPKSGGATFGLNRAAQPLEGTPVVAVTKTGFNCTKCNDKNDFAESNQPNGTYVCYQCRG